MFLIRRGSPCCVRRSSRDQWRRHVCAEDRTELSQRVVYNDGPAWAFEVGGWEMLVEPRFLERSESWASTWHIGITGTREGAAEEPIARLRHQFEVWLVYALWGPPTFHHGGCVGADRQTHTLIRDVWGKTARIVIHPASDQPERLCDWRDADEMTEPKKSLDRNRDIVTAVSPGHTGGLLLALPRTAREEQRSGTWSTIRAAERAKVGVITFAPPT